MVSSPRTQFPSSRLWAPKTLYSGGRSGESMTHVKLLDRVSWWGIRRRRRDGLVPIDRRKPGRTEVVVPLSAARLEQITAIAYVTQSSKRQYSGTKTEGEQHRDRLPN
jgi:hypothetical protein